MRTILGDRSRRTKRDLLEARLMLQVNGSTMEAGVARALDAIERQEAQQPGEGPDPAPGQVRSALPVPRGIGPGPGHDDYIPTLIQRRPPVPVVACPPGEPLSGVVGEWAARGKKQRRRSNQ
jgi:hypothetical protein